MEIFIGLHGGSRGPYISSVCFLLFRTRPLAHQIAEQTRPHGRRHPGERGGVQRNRTFAACTPFGDLVRSERLVFQRLSVSLQRFNSVDTFVIDDAPDQQSLQL